CLALLWRPVFGCVLLPLNRAARAHDVDVDPAPASIPGRRFGLAPPIDDHAAADIEVADAAAGVGIEAVQLGLMEIVPDARPLFWQGQADNGDHLGLDL